ncbi:hypothetical protein JYP49_06150 [Nitratireductor aquimarinus]|nr:hypothetical protein [Nitratireductor pacificus]MBN7780163.1 hypothetical protein [Nitratireductor pacificus]MBN7788970.1 hypothetical protein [Nitratireductor aquimarinus]MBY6099038.1 hypothetical protein [Nitratireductor aquimarinus]
MATALASSPVNAGEADVVAVEIIADGDGTHRFDVTVEHGDEGWEHYADRWDVLDDAGRVIASRTLLHPHVNEQPFTRSLSGVALPGGLDHVTVRAHDTVHGLGGRIMRVAIPGREGEGG